MGLTDGDTVIAVADAPWAPFPSGDGVRFTLLNTEARNGAWTAVLDLGADSTGPVFRHFGGSEFFVVSGGGPHLRRGSYFNRRATYHAPFPPVGEPTRLLWFAFGPLLVMRPDGPSTEMIEPRTLRQAMAAVPA